MNADEWIARLAEYETNIVDMMQEINYFVSELKGTKNRSDFEEGRLSAYSEMLDIINIRHNIIMEVLDDNATDEEITG